MPRTRRMQKLEKEEKLSKEKSQPKQEKQQDADKEKEQKVEPKQQTQEQQVIQIKQKSKPKCTKNPKKYLKKTYQQQVRIQRSKHDRIFLLSAARNKDNWHFLVQGTKGSHYNVSISTQVDCTCMDFRLKKIPCKHIYFIVTQVGQNDQLLGYFKNDRKISKSAYKILDQQLFNRLKSRIEKPSKEAKDIDLRDDKDCVICFSQMEKQTEPLQDCSTCKKYFHTQCLSAWKNHNSTCPLCRGTLTNPIDNNDPLGKMIDIKI